ncbi:MAG TPA: hypothetical protein PLD20_04325 [Blastocatellia bacterium]|nr:hypothetical protein [Blastocatellia bacterium]HMX28037.1 hypothetical protein [Blastocatellia bacterium]HMZ17132.1 hypothetical protein [Blastocatellia bacterium]HNG32618.1 hypothetical protein [Blastocatellia bacterium]
MRLRMICLCARLSCCALVSLANVIHINASGLELPRATFSGYAPNRMAEMRAAINAIPSQGGYNLLRNPGFEAGVLDPWSGINPNGIFIRRYANEASNYALVTVDQRKGNSINQDVVFNEAGTFEFSATVWCNKSQNQEIRIVVWELGGGGTDSPAEEPYYVDDSQRTFKVKITKNRSRSKLRVEIYPDRNAPLTFYVDNAKLIKIS